MSGLKKTYSYYCTTESAWVKEEKDEAAAVPSTCKNDGGHTIKLDSLYTESNNPIYCSLKPMTGTGNASATLNTTTMTLSDIAERLYVLELCALKKGLLREM